MSWNKRAQVIPYTDWILNMSQNEAENLLFWEEEFSQVKDWVEKILTEVENLNDWPEKESKKNSLLKKIAAIENNQRKWTIFTDLWMLEQDESKKEQNYKIARTRYKRFLDSTLSSAETQTEIWKAQLNLWNTESHLWDQEKALHNYYKIDQDAWEIFIKSCFNIWIIHFESDNFKEAQKRWSQIPNTHRLFGNICVAQWRKALESDDFELAIYHFSNIPQENELFWYAQYELWVICFDNKSYTSALKYMDNAGEYWEKIYVLWMSHFYLWDNEMAIHFLEQVVAQDTDFLCELSLYVLSVIYYNKSIESNLNNDSIQSIKYAEQFIELYDGDEELKEEYFRVCLLLWILYTWEKRIQFLERVTDEANSKIYWEAQRQLWYIEWLKDWSENN